MSAEPTIRDEWVEKAAKAMFNDGFMRHAPEHVARWDDEDDEGVRESWRVVARAALEAVADDIRADALRAAAAYQWGDSGMFLMIRNNHDPDFADQLIGLIRSGKLVTDPTPLGQGYLRDPSTLETLGIVHEDEVECSDRLWEMLNGARA